MSFVKESLSVFGTRILLIVIYIISSIIVTRILGPSNRGIMEILIQTPFLLVNLGNFGINFANTHYVGRKKYSIELIASNSLSISLILGVILIFIAYISFFFYRRTVFKDISLYYTYLVFPIIPFLLFHKYIQYIIVGKEEITARNIIVILPAVINFILTIFLIVIIKLNVLGVLIASFASNCFAFLICYYYISRKSEIRLSFDYKLFVESVKFGLIPFLTLCVINLIYRADIFLIKYYLDNTAVGLYSLGVTIVEKVWLLAEAIGLVLFARISNISENEANALTPVVCRLCLFSSFLVGIILFVSARIFIPFIFGDEFQESVKPLLILSPGIVLMTLFIILNYDLTGRGRAKITLYVFIIALFINIILNLIFIPTYGINGAAMASTVSYSIGSLGLAMVYAKINSISFVDLILPQKIDFVNYLIPLAKNVKNRLVSNSLLR